MNDKPALHHAGRIVKSCLGAHVHISDPLISAFAQKFEIGVALTPHKIPLPGLRIQALPVLVFGAQRFIRCLTVRRRGWSKQSRSNGRECHDREPSARAFFQGVRATASHAGRARDGPRDRVCDGGDVRDHARARGHGDAAAPGGGVRAGLR